MNYLCTDLRRKVKGGEMVMVMYLACRDFH